LEKPVALLLSTRLKKDSAFIIQSHKILFILIVFFILFIIIFFFQISYSKRVNSVDSGFFKYVKIIFLNTLFFIFSYLPLQYL
jgi:hypothetical protein